MVRCIRDSSESRSRSLKGCVPEHFVFAGDWGGASTSKKITRSAKAVSGDFLCLWPHMHCLPICNVFKHKHCLQILFLQKFDRVCAFHCKKECSDLVVSKTGKQGIWRATCEKTPFPIPTEAVFLWLVG